MQYNTSNLHHMITDEPRESWIDIVKPLILNEDECSLTLQNNWEYGITLDTLSPDYRCKFNINDIVYFEGLQWIVMSWPLLDNRHSIEDIKLRSISAIECGAYLEILRPNPDGIDGKLYLNNEFICNISYNDSVTEKELSLVSDNEISEEMSKFKESILNPNHRVDLLW